MNHINERILQFSANSNLINKLKPEKTSHYKNGFEPIEGTIEELEQLIKVGICFSYQYVHGVRNTKNFLRADLLAVDMDGGREIDDCLNDQIVKNYGSLFYTTPSHTPDHHRFRLVFILPRTITKVDELKSAARALTRRLGGDMTATDGARIFFGSTDCRSQLLGKAITNEYLDELIEDGKTNPVSDSINNAGIAASRSNQKLEPNLNVKTSEGDQIFLKDINKKVQIYCPFHHDKRPSAFVARNNRGSIYLHCSSCNITRWVNDGSSAGYDFDGFERAIKEINTGIYNKGGNELTYLEEVLGPQLIPTKNIHISNDQYLNLTKINDGLTLIKSPKGSGKTTYLSRALGQVIANYSSLEDYENATFDNDNNDVKIYTNTQVLLIGHRQALIGDLCKRLGLNSYLDDKNEKQQVNEHRKSRYGVCLDSLWKVEAEKYDIIVIDEVEQVLGHFLSATLGSSRERIFRIFSKLLQKTSKIVVLDADLGWVTFNTLYSVLTNEDNGLFSEIHKAKPLPIHVYANDWKQENKTINIYPSDTQLIQHIKTNIIGDKRIFITSNSKKKIKVIEKIVAKIANEADVDIPAIAITSDNSNSKQIQKFIKNIKEDILKYKVIMSSPSLGTGIDITFENNNSEIDCVYGLFETRINSHFEIDQQLARVRHPKEVNVWISPRRYNFETDINVVTDDCLRADLIQSFDEGIIRTSPIIPPFLSMAAIITATHRASKNNLKGNFIEYKKKLNWGVNFIEKDKTLSDEGNELYKLMKNQTEQEDIDNILGARTLNEYEFEKFKEKTVKYNISAEPAEWYNLFRTNLELFYGEPVVADLIAQDNKGQLRKSIRLFEAIQNEPKLSPEEKDNLNTQEKKKLAKIRYELIYDRRHSAVLLHGLLSLTPIFQNGKFDPDVIFSTNDLKEFGVSSQRLSKFVTTQLGIETRLDVIKKPVQHLWGLLKLVGLAQDKSIKPQKIKDEKIYRYKISNESLETILYYIKKRQFSNPNSDEIAKTHGWAFVNDLHGFKYNGEEMDYIYRDI